MVDVETTSSEELVRVRFSADAGVTRIYFEPMGTEFRLALHDQIQLELPLGDVRDLEIHVVDDGVAVWLTHGNEHGVLDKDGNLIERI